MEDLTIFSIGHGRKSFSEFLDQLKKYDIKYLIDVRSFPMSKSSFHFNRPWLADDLPKENIIYKFLGDKLGGLPKDKTCYTNGKVDYSKLREKDFFQEGVRQIIEASKNNINIALMCSESNPTECHRSKLIGQELLKFRISVNHIFSDKIMSQKRVMDEFTKGKGVINLFGESNFTSRNTYSE